MDKSILIKKNVYGRHTCMVLKWKSTMGGGSWDRLHERWTVIRSSIEWRPSHPPFHPPSLSSSHYHLPRILPPSSFLPSHFLLILPQSHSPPSHPPSHPPSLPPIHSPYHIPFHRFDAKSLMVAAQNYEMKNVLAEVVYIAIVPETVRVVSPFSCIHKLCHIQYINNEQYILVDSAHTLLLVENSLLPIQLIFDLWGERGGREGGGFFTFF